MGGAGLGALVPGRGVKLGSPPRRSRGGVRDPAAALFPRDGDSAGGQPARGPGVRSPLPLHSVLNGNYVRI